MKGEYVQGVLVKPRIMNTILQNIGGTPVVNINHVAKDEGLDCEFLAKCEFFNAGGSIKDRIALRMVEEAEKQGKITPGVSTIIEPTSGNTGIGLALAGAIKNYRVIITLPEKMSDEKVNTLKALGAEVIRTPTEAAWDAPESHIGVARRLEKEIPNAIILDQYGNLNNPQAHYFGTGEEIVQACEGKLDMLVISAGTGGTLSGIARRVKEAFPKCLVVGVDPHGSLLAQPESLNTRVGSYLVEGIGYDFIPDVLDRSLADYWVKTDDKESFLMARQLIRKEGLLCGGSSGATMVGAIKAAKHFGMTKQHRVLVILADSVRNYMSKFLSDEWMKRNNFIDEGLSKNDKFEGKTVVDMRLPLPLTVSKDMTCRQAALVMEKNGIEYLPIVRDGGIFIGCITSQILSRKLTSGQISMNDPISSIMSSADQVRSNLVLADLPISSLATRLDKEQAVVVVSNLSTQKMTVEYVITKIDLLKYMTEKESKNQ